MSRTFIICTILFSIPFIFNFHSNSEIKKQFFHTEQERQSWEAMLDTLPDGYNGLFLSSSACIECHGFDTAQIASIDMMGNDINLVDDWQATMMANSAKDPFWRAKVSHETLLYPQHRQEIETKCTSCHAPLGHFAAFHNGEDHYGIEELKQDSFGLDGVSCLACHQQSELNLGNTHSGELHFDTAKVAYGPFTSPLESPMLMSTDYEPVFSEHISDAGLCAGCHTLITQTIDLEGNLTENRFVEQATYHEWLNSSYNTNEISCQTCHLPVLNRGNFILIAGHDTEPRDRFYLHELTGANTFMLNLMKNNIEALDIRATPEQFDEVIQATMDILKNQTLSLRLTTLERTLDTAFFELRLINKAGHKFPSGYPSRRAFITFLVENMAGDTLFLSGRMNENFEIVDETPNFEPHHDIITDEQQTQIYEIVAADVAGNFTTVLERAAYPLKDNRLPPEGFTTSHEVYDTTQIVGKALTDDNFNHSDFGEGTGGDFVFYHIPMDGNNEALNIKAQVYYQALPPKWMEEIFSESTEEIDLFRTMFEATDGTPVLMQEATLSLDMISSTPIANTPDWVNAFPTINFQEPIHIHSKQIHDLEIYNLQGKLLQKYTNRQGNYQIMPPIDEGILILHFLREQQRTIRKIVIIN